MKQVTKAVIAAAGMGTRFLPQTKAMPKEMLPIIDKPVIQLVVEGLVEAGVQDIIIVTGPTKRAIEDHFDRSLELEQELRAKGKPDIANQLESIAGLANFVYIRQKGEPRGNARPILNAAHLLGNEPFFFFFADDFFSGDVSTASQMAEAYREHESTVVALRQVPAEEVSMYGIVEVIDKVSDNTVQVGSVAEKPGAEDAPSDLAVASGYLLTPSVLPILQKEQTGPDGEIRISDAVEQLAKTENVYGQIIKGEYHDTGNPEAYMKTLINMTLQDPEKSVALKKFLRDKNLSK